MRIAGIRKLTIIGSILLGLFLTGFGYKAWSLTSVRKRPWILEAEFRSLLAECRTGPGFVFFRKEWDDLQVRSREAESCLVENDARIWFRRNYDDCISIMLSAGLDAKLLAIKLRQRHQDQIKILTPLLQSMKAVLDDIPRDGKTWRRFNLNSLEEGRAKSLVKQAEILHAKGEIETALLTVMRARISWQRFNSQNEERFARFSNANQRRKWELQVSKALQWSKRSGRRAIIVDKFEHLCFLIDGGRIQKRYKADLGRKWYQRKSRAQDAATPEGEYIVTRLIPYGKYGNALLINYPSAEDKARFQSLKRNGSIPASSGIGGNIEIHGRGGRETDWTDGCIALDDEEMRELYRFAYAGMPVTIVGTSHWTSVFRN